MQSNNIIRENHACIKVMLYVQSNSPLMLKEKFKHKFMIVNDLSQWIDHICYIQPSSYTQTLTLIWNHFKHERWRELMNLFVLFVTDCCTNLQDFTLKLCHKYDTCSEIAIAEGVRKITLKNIVRVKLPLSIEYLDAQHSPRLILINPSIVIFIHLKRLKVHFNDRHHELNFDQFPHLQHLTVWYCRVPLKVLPASVYSVNVHSISNFAHGILPEHVTNLTLRHMYNENTIPEHLIKFNMTRHHLNLKLPVSLKYLTCRRVRNVNEDKIKSNTLERLIIEKDSSLLNNIQGRINVLNLPALQHLKWT